MQDQDKTLYTLAIIGALIGIGKLLVSDEQLTIRLALGRMILGVGVSLIPGALLLHFAEINPLALIGVASAFGILGSTYIELYLKKLAKKWGGE